MKKICVFIFLLMFVVPVLAFDNPLMQQKFWVSATSADVEKAIKNGSNPKEIDTYMATPLHFACMFSNDVEAIKVILGKGVDVNKKDRYGFSPLMLSKNIKVAEELIKNGADINARDGDGNPVLIQFLEDEKWDIAELLVDNGANISIKNRFGTKASELARLFNAPDSLKNKLSN
jgi:ankyrin repeat protein